MSTTHFPEVIRKARKQHICICCHWPIPKGESYIFQAGFHDGHSYNNKYHSECFEVLCEEATFEFTPGSGDPPDRIQKLFKQIRDEGP